VLFYAREFGAPQINFFELLDEQKELYKEGDGENSHKWRDFLRTGGYSTPEERPNSYYPIYFNPKTNHISLDKENPDYIKILPLDSRAKKGWRNPRFIPGTCCSRKSKISKLGKELKVQIIDRIKQA
jgi:adenine-specific DNA-methyltransferase